MRIRQSDEDGIGTGASRKSLRIALVVPAFVPAVEYGGPVTKVRALACGLRDLGHRPEVWCADYGPDRSRLPTTHGEVDGIPVRYLRRLASYRWSPVAPQAAVLAARRSMDVGHCFGMWDGLTLFAALGFRRAGVPYAVEPLGMYPPMLRNVPYKRAFQALLANRYLAGSEVLIATSEREAELLRGHTDKPVTVRANPMLLPPEIVDPGNLRGDLGIPLDVALLGWLGRISRSKGLDVLVEAMSSLPGFHLAIAGPDDRDGAMDVLLAAVRRFQVADRVHIVGPLWNQDKDRFLASIDVFVLPSVTENFGNAAVEAAAVGLPLVLSDRVGAATWLASIGAAVVTPLDPEALANAIVSLCRTDASADGTERSSSRVRAAVSPQGVGGKQALIYDDMLRGKMVD
jgi:glycosyltransferase involved in cell wall biosynthesis